MVRNNKSANKLLHNGGNDIYYTPIPVVKTMIELCDILPNQKVLDCSAGDMRFFNNYPEHCIKDWCEITKGRDFFQYNEKVDWIISNPPYSILTKWIEHTIKICDAFCFIINYHNLTDTRLRFLKEAGWGCTKIHILRIDWWYSMQVIVVFEKNKPSICSVHDNVVICDICGTKCRRGRAGNGPNQCSKLGVVISS